MSSENYRAPAPPAGELPEITSKVMRKSQKRIRINLSLMVSNPGTLLGTVHLAITEDAGIFRVY